MRHCRVRLAELAPELVFGQVGEKNRRGCWSGEGPLEEVDLRTLPLSW